MAQPIKRLLELSSELSESLETCGFEDIETYMERRNALFAELQRPDAPPFNEDEKESLRRLAVLDEAIVGRMRWLHRQIGSEIQRIQIGKKSRMMYDGDAPVYDGVFFDSRR